MTRDRRGDFMKDLESVHKRKLDPNEYVLIRIDGRAFHTYTRDLDTPYDFQLSQAMDTAAKELAESIQGVRAAYTQSDEISLLISAWSDPESETPSELWCGGVEAKLVSLSASIATAAFNKSMPSERPSATFDSRVWNVATPTVVQDYFAWRRSDCIRNSISSCASVWFSHKELHGKHSGDKIEMLKEVGAPWENQDDSFRFGRLLTKSHRDGAVSYKDPRTGDVQVALVEKSFWSPLPFTSPEMLYDHIPARREEVKFDYVS